MEQLPKCKTDPKGKSFDYKITIELQITKFKKLVRKETK